MRAAWTGRMFLLALLLLALSPLGAGHIEEDWHTAPCDASSLNKACFANLSAAVQRTPGLWSSFQDVSAAVLECVGIKGTVIRPLRLLALAESSKATDPIIAMFKEASGWDVSVEYVPLVETGSRVLDTAAAKTRYDGWLTIASWTLDLSDQDMVEVLDNYVNEDPLLDWADFDRFIRSSSCVYNGSVVGVPLGSGTVLMNWRTDLLSNAKQPVPNTWQELVEVARAINGTDFNGDGIPDYAICWQIHNLDIQQGLFVQHILASMTQTQGIASGWLFDIDTMKPFVDSEAMTAALYLVQQLLPYINPQQDTDFFNRKSITGECALQFKSSQFKGMQRMSRFKGKIGSGLMPGSDTVLDRASGKLAACTPLLCTHATWSVGRDGTPQLVNRAPGGLAGIMGMVNPHAPHDYQLAMYQFFAFYSLYRNSFPLVVGPSPVQPFRYSHLSTSDASLAAWERAGYNVSEVVQYLHAMRESLDSPNTALDLRIKGGPAYMSALALSVVALINGSDVATAQSALVRRFAAITAKTPLQQLADGYYAGLNIKRKILVPPPPVASGSSGSSSSDGSSSDMKSEGVLVGIIVGSVVGGLCLLLVAMVVARKTLVRQWRLLFVHHRAPGVGPGTTLLVTDIENSTALWESLDQNVMTRALELHDGLAKSLLAKHWGYLSATEGDAFIVCFHTPTDALHFAQAFQAGLLLLDWPPELLACALAKPVWAMLAGGKKSHSVDAVGSPMSFNSLLSIAPADNRSGTPSTHMPRHGSWVIPASEVDLHFTDDSTTRLADLLRTLPAVPSRNDLGSRTVLGLSGVVEVEAQSAMSYIAEGWAECLPPPSGNAPTNRTLVHRGLRVRIGLHSGLTDAQDVITNPTTGRTEYSGALLCIAKAMGDCGHGGMVLLSHACLDALPLDSLEGFGTILNMGVYAFLKDGSVPSAVVYQTIARGLEGRLAFTETDLRSTRQLQAGVLQAPVGHASIVFANVVGASALLAWDRGVATRALDLFQEQAVQIMQRTDLAGLGSTQPGYVAELAGGLCLAAFHSPGAAIMWGLNLIDGLLQAAWEPDLLEHDLCEEVVVGQQRLVASFANMPRAGAMDAQLPWPPATTERQDRILFRGLRLKIGVDRGSVAANINSSTGRMAYRGRVMNRAARIADRAGSGQLWCSKAAWDLFEAMRGADRPCAACQPLGPLSLKGVAGPMDLVQCFLVKQPDMLRSSASRPYDEGTDG